METKEHSEADPVEVHAGPWARRLRLLAVLALAAALRLSLVLSGRVPFNGDEAVVALMARHILQGERPVFFYGQHYMGSLDAWLVAGAFAVLGESVLTLRLVQIALCLGTVATTYWLGRRIFGSEWIAGYAALLMALPPVLVTLYTTATLGNYGEVLLLGNCAVLLALALVERPPEGGAWVRLRAPAPRVWAAWAVLGVLSGLGFWALPLMLVYVLPVVVLLAVAGWRDRRLAPFAVVWVVGFAVGAAPWLIYTARFGLDTLAEATGAAAPRGQPTNLVFSWFRHIGYFLLFGLTVIWGLRPPWGAQFLAMPLLPYALALHLAAALFGLRRAVTGFRPGAVGRAILLGVTVCLVGAFILLPFGDDPSGRYFLPLTVVVALFLAEMLHWLRLRRRRRRTPWRKWFAQMLALGVLAFNWWANMQTAFTMPPGITTQFDVIAQIDHRHMPALMQFLREHGETRGYSNYWVAYPLAFASGEELIFAPRLPYHIDQRYSPRDNRYPPYLEAVEASERAAYITTRNPVLDERLRAALAAAEVTYEETVIGDYRVFYALSRKVTPEALGLIPQP